MRRDEERLRDILQAIEKIERYAARGRQALESDELLQTWIVHHSEIIGEAARAMSEAIRKAHPEIPWRELSMLRNELIHEYFSIDVDEVWNVVEKDLPDLKRKITAVLVQLRGSS